MHNNNSTEKRRPSVSIVVPCYRDSATLARALDSLYSQTYRPAEIIVVNDASPETAEIDTILSRYPGVLSVCNQTNLGLAATRNVGVAHASGDLVAFLDADDEYHPQKLELQLAVHRGGAAVTCGLQTVPMDVTARPTCQRYADSGRVSRYADIRRQSYRNSLNGAGLLIERGLLLQVGGYDEALRSCEDFDLWCRLMSLGVSVFKVEHPLYLYHYNPAGLSKNYRNISYWELRVLQKYFASSTNAFSVRQQQAILFVRLFKHLWRAALSRDDVLERVTLEHVRGGLLNRGLGRSLLSLLGGSRLLWLLAKARSLGVSARIR